jgi:hypothetical protein
MCPDRLILYTKCALMCLQGLSGQNHVGIPVRAHRGCALTCALKNRAYGASVPAGGVCLQGQFDGSPTLDIELAVRILKSRFFG